eukprot:XP_011455748.1 PREDICTED: uncharacterized protein LOC105348132 [Crassostrea gigas]
MNYSFLLFLVLFIELCKSLNRYCQEAVASVTVVDSCPTSKTEWDVAARKKNCGRMASQQNCTTVEKYQYHCVVNGLRSELLEVCAPTRIIFGHCVEFNVLGGVIQDQPSAPCNATFPKCAEFYLSSDIYQYPDCYKLVLKNEASLAFEEKTTTVKNTLITTNGSGQKKSFRSVWICVFISVLIIAVVLGLIICIRKHRKQPNRKHNEAVSSSVENGEGGVRYVNIESEPCMEIEDEERTCLIPKKVEVEQDIQHSSSDQSLSRRFSQSESAVNNSQDRPSSQSLRQPVDQDIRRKTSTQSQSQRFANTDSAAYKKGFKVSDFLM